MTYAEMFDKIKSMLDNADVSAQREHLRYQFNITGEAAGAFYIEVRDGALYIEPYEYYDRDALFTCTAETLFKLVSGKTDPVAAVMLGRLKVEGSIEKALKLKELLAQAKL